MADHTVTRDGPDDGRFTMTLACDGEPFASQLFNEDAKPAEVDAWAKEHTAAHVTLDHAAD